MNAPLPPGNWFVGWPAALSAGWLAELRKGAPHDLRWFQPEDCHVTLAFFGRLATETVGAICEHLAHTPVQSFAGTVGALCLLPSARHFSAVSLAIESEARRIEHEIEAHRDEWLALAGRPPETRPALAHLTVARPERRANHTALRRIRQWAEGMTISHSEVVTFEGPALFTWAEDRPRQQFRIVAHAGDAQLAAH